MYRNKKVNAKSYIECCTLYYIKDKRGCAIAMAAHGNRLEPIKSHEGTALFFPYMTKKAEI
jgi:hypothetical protein